MDDGALVLGLGLTSSSSRRIIGGKQASSKFDDDIIEPSLALGLSPSSSAPPPPHHRLETKDHSCNKNNNTSNNNGDSSDVSSFSVKRERDLSSEEDAAVRERTEEELVDVGASPRKKLRLTKQQSALLEESFNQHITLNPKQKQGLARQLNLRPRQVEVWFQNRRARTKLKQTEMDCEVLKKCCDALTDENRRLHRELHQLKPFLLNPAPLALLCPTCQRLASAAATDHAHDHAHAHAHARFYKPFPANNNPSAAC